MTTDPATPRILDDPFPGHADPWVPGEASFEQRAGLWVADVGDEGDVLILGHHDATPEARRRLLVAVYRHHRITAGILPGEYTVADLTARLEPRWAAFTQHSADCDRDSKAEQAALDVEQPCPDEGDHCIGCRWCNAELARTAALREACEDAGCDSYSWWVTWSRTEPSLRHPVAVTLFRP